MKDTRTTAWFHCFAGTAGDMTLAALVNAGADATAVAEIVARLPIDNYALTFEPTMRCGLAATRAIVAVDPHDHDSHDRDNHNPYTAIREMLTAADLPDRVRDRAQKTFLLLAEVEGAMHGVAPDQVEFHEVGSVDAIIDIVERRGRDVFPYVRSKLNDTIGSWGRDKEAKRLIDVAATKGWWDLWTAAVRTGPDTHYKAGVAGVLEDRALSEDVRKERLRALGYLE